MPDYNRLKIQDLRQIAKEMGLLRPDRDKKKDLIVRIEKGRQLSDYSKTVLLEQAQNIGLKANAQMSKETILKKLTTPSLQDLGEERLREVAKQRGVRLRGNMSGKDIIERIENPTKYYTVENLKGLAKDNNIKIRQGQTRQEIIDVSTNAKVISPTEKIEVSNLGVMAAPNTPLALIEKFKKIAPKNARESLEEYREYLRHIRRGYLTTARLCKLKRTLEKKENKAREETLKKFTPIKTQSALKEFANVYTIGRDSGTRWYGCPDFEGYDGYTFLRVARITLVPLLKKIKGIKVKLDFHCNMVRKTDEGPLVMPFQFHSDIELNLGATDEEELYEKMIDRIEEKIQATIEAEMSGWGFHSVIKLEMHTVTYKPLGGGSYIKLPKEIATKKAVVNMKNTKDDQCFLWCVLRALNPVKRDKELIDGTLKSKIDTVNMGDIHYPVTLKDVSKFEKLNPGIAVSVYAYDENYSVGPLQISEHVERPYRIKLLLISDENKTHYCLIEDFSRLISSQASKHKGKVYVCERCINAFTTENALKEHEKHCTNKDCVYLKMPTPGSTISFKHFERGQRVPFVIYADFESLLKPISRCEPNPKISSTTKYQKHEPISFSYYIKCFEDAVCDLEPRTYTGEDATEKFIEWLEKDVKYISNIRKEKMIFGEKEAEDFNNATDCWVCKGELGPDKVRDHCHLTGRYRGAAHNQCNLKYRKLSFTPVVIHNLTNYNAHLFVKHLGYSEGDISCIANNDEKYISFSKQITVGAYEKSMMNKEGGFYSVEKPIHHTIRFIDSFRFMSTSLGKLVNNLPETAFQNVGKYYTKEKLDLIKRKGVYPYEYMDSIERFKETRLPPKESFYSSLNDEYISDEDYEHAKKVWGAFGMKSLEDYHELYNKTDALLLADVFENFRNICSSNYGLDPAHYYTSPGLAWDACLKITEVELELLSNVDMLLMIEKGIRGGVSMVSKRFARANNKYMGEKFDREKGSRFIQYLDANNLYGMAMSMKLPTRGFKWMNKRELNVWEKVPSILEVDLHYPERLHDTHNDYPLAPESIECDRGIKKLIPTLRDKKRYVLHYETLKQYLALGMELTYVHRGIKFEESHWLKPYIDMNTTLRAKAANEFEKDFFKLMNNSVFGKTMENIRNRKDIKLVSNRDKAIKYAAKPNFHHSKIFSETLVTMHMKRTSLTFNKPVYLGLSILDLSKAIMYEFHYDYIKPKYDDRVSLLYTDTDSLVYEIETEDFYKDISADVMDRFDTSNYKPNHPSGIPTGCNKKVLGKFKDEKGGECIEEFAALRAKLYTFKMNDGEENKKCKGIKKRVVEKSIVHEDYKTCLFELKEQRRQMNVLRSYNHTIYTETVNKVALSPFDDKRYILEDNINTLAWGHHKIPTDASSPI